MPRILKPLVLLSVSSLFLACASVSHASSVRLRVSEAAIAKLLVSQLFTKEGKYYVGAATRCQYAYLTNPVVTVVAGGVIVRAQFSGMQGTEMLGNCVGASDAFGVVAGISLGAVDGKLVVKLDSLERNGGSSWSDLLVAAARAALPPETLVDPAALLRAALADSASGFVIDVGVASLSRIAIEEKSVVLEGSIAVDVR